MTHHALASLVLTACAAAFAAPTAVAQGVKGDVARAEGKVAMCIGCHGIAGYQSSFPEVYKVPKISGQSEKYLAAALTAYKKGERRHPSMRAIAGSLSEEDIADVSAYYAQHGGPADPAPEQPALAPSASVDALLKKGACASCHGANFSKPIDGAYPKLAGQHADYLAAALRAYGVEGNPNLGRAQAIMSGMVKPFTRSELKAMADYIASLPGELKTVRQSPFHSASR